MGGLIKVDYAKVKSHCGVRTLMGGNTLSRLFMNLARVVWYWVVSAESRMVLYDRTVESMATLAWASLLAVLCTEEVQLLLIWEQTLKARKAAPDLRSPVP